MGYMKQWYSVLLWCVAVPLIGLAQPAWLDDGLVAYYPFDGDAKDYSSNNFNGNLEGGAVVSDYLSLDGDNDFFFTDRPIRLESPITWAFQVRIPVIGANNGGMIASIQAPPHHWMPNFHIQRNTEYTADIHIGGSKPFNMLNVRFSGDWHSVVITSTASHSVSFYLDGRKIDQMSDLGLWHREMKHFVLGGYWPTKKATKVDIDEFRIYNRALSPTEVFQLHVSDSGLPLPGRADAIVVAGFVVGANILFPGRGYNNQPEINFVGGNPVEEAQAEVRIEEGKIVSINITNAGSGYQEVPSVRIESPPSKALLNIEVSKIETIVPESERPRRAIAAANVINGFLVSADIVDGGAGYEQAPIVTVSDATGTGALAAATIENGVVTSVQFVKAGIGYSGKALIQFQSPQPNPDAIPRVTEVELSMQLTFPNNYYVIEASSDLVNWEQIVEPFFAEEATHAVKVAVDDEMRYFRAIQLP